MSYDSSIISIQNKLPWEKVCGGGVMRCGVVSQETLEGLEKLYHGFSVQWQQTGFYSSMMISDADYRTQVSAQISALVMPALELHLSNFDILFSNFLVKLPRTDNHIGIHQDWNFVNEAETASINFWIPLQDVDDSNGNLYMVENSHEHFKQLRGTPYLNYFRGYEQALEKKAVPLYPKRGELFLYHGRAIHFSRPNLSDKLRLAVGGVIIPQGAAALHYRNNGNELSPEWKQYSVDKKFFETFTPEQQELEGYTAVPVSENINAYTDTLRRKTIEDFLSIK